MGDTRLRQLEREAAGGDLQARAHLLRERTRTGDLASERLSLAAYLGDEASREALALGSVDDEPSLESWVRGLSDWGEPACARAAAAAARLLWPRVPVEDELPRRALASVEAFLECPCASHRLAVIELSQARSNPEGWTVPRWALPTPEMAAWWATVVVWGPNIRQGPTIHPAEATWGGVHAVVRSLGANAEESVRAAIRTALVPWALR